MTLFIVKSMICVLPGYYFTVESIAIHCEINDIRIAWMLTHRKNNTSHCKTNDIRIAWV